MPESIVNLRFQSKWIPAFAGMTLALIHFLLANNAFNFCSTA